MDDFLQRQGIYLSNNELLAFFKRVDKSDNSRISYEDFKCNVLPIISPVRGLASTDDILNENV